ncbi:MAG: phosphoribulokinase, partial [Gammaproteobacteria bacterium]|nr:phosphoribulokinase [Gammaproteobacteria bacterium]
MSKKHPIVAITGSSGAGTSTVKTAFEHLFWRLKIKAAVIEGDSYHCYDRKEMARVVSEGDGDRRALSHFGPRANLFGKLEETFKTYSETGNGQVRKYLHNEEEAE